jgi:hypothetical protein
MTKKLQLLGTENTHVSSIDFSLLQGLPILKDVYSVVILLYHVLVVKYITASDH